MSDEELIQQEDEELVQMDNQFLLCRLSNEDYGISISDVQSIEELQSIVEVPDMPSYVKGVINLRGKVIPVIDMRLKLKMQEKEYDDRTCIVIVKIDDADVGLIVDTVSEVVSITEENIEPAPSFKDGRGDSRYISGIGKTEEEVKILLDVSKLLESEVMEEIAAKA